MEPPDLRACYGEEVLQTSGKPFGRKAKNNTSVRRRGLAARHKAGGLENLLSIIRFDSQGKVHNATGQLVRQTAGNKPMQKKNDFTSWNRPTSARVMERRFSKPPANRLAARPKCQYTLINQLINSQEIKSEQFLDQNHKNSGEFR